MASITFLPPWDVSKEPDCLPTKHSEIVHKAFSQILPKPNFDHLADRGRSNHHNAAMQNTSLLS